MPTSSPIASAATQGKLRISVAKQVLAGVLRGEIKGPWLVEQDLADRFGVSRTPIREAIAELARLGLVEQYPNRGAQLLPLGPVQLRELYSVRAIMEMEATRLVASRFDVNEFTDLKQRLEALLAKTRRGLKWSQAEIELDHRFHELIAARCGNDRLAREIARYFELAEVMREMMRSDTAVQARGMQEHIRVFDALIAGDAEAAALAMRQHIESAGEVASSCLYSTEQSLPRD